MIEIKHFTFNSFQTRCCVVWDESKNCAIVDPGCAIPEEIAALKGFISEKGLTPVCIMLTHGHFDHILGVADIVKAYPAADGGQLRVYMDSKDIYTLEQNEFFNKWFGAPIPNMFVTTDIHEGSIIEVGGLRFEVIETPGHTVGGVCYLERNEKILFSGDTLFAGAIGRTDHPGGNYDTIMKSIMEKLINLPGDTIVVPGHGPCSDISTEGMTNPFLQPFNEPYED